jgi:hypothetical protein
MKRAVCVLVLSLTGCCFGQVVDSASAPDGGIATIFPSAQMSPSVGTSDQQPSYPQTQSSWDLTTPEVEKLIQERLYSESTLENTKLEVRTDDSEVMITGTVANNRQRELANEIAKAYAGNRRIRDQIKLSGL